MELLKPTKPRLRNPYPAIAFADAYNYLVELRKATSSRAFNRAALLKGLGFSDKNVVGDNVIGSLAHFGLVYRVDGKKIGQPSDYHITDDAITLLDSEQDPQRWVELARKHATTPELFHYLYEKYGESLPQSVSAELIKKYRLVTSKNVSKLILRYAKSLAFVRESSVLPAQDHHLKSERNSPAEIHIDMGDGIMTVLPLSSLPKILKWYWSHPHPEDSQQDQR